VTWTFTTTGVVTNATLFPSTETPAVASANDNNAQELGVKFTSDKAGYVTGVRFYKGSGNTGTHVGHLWTAGGTLLASATFTGESGTGWQQATFSSPVAVSAGATYVASYSAPAGHYAYTSGYFASGGVSSGVLHAPAAATASSGPSTPCRRAVSTRRTTGLTSSSATPSPPSSPPRRPREAPPGFPRPRRNLTATFSKPVVAGTISFVLKDAANNVVPTTVAYSSANNTATFTRSRSSRR